MINVKLKTRENIDVQLQPKQGIKIDSSNKYLFDPTLIQGYVDLTKDYSDKAMQSEANAKASEMNAELSAEQAKASEDSAKLSETRAKESELNAKTSENNAKESETKARQEANASAESAYQSQQSALASSQYASNAESDSQNALETLEHVLESEGRAKNYSDLAQASSVIAIEKTEEVKASVAEAKASEVNAKASEINAKESEQKSIQEANASAESAYQSQQSALASAEYASNAESDAQNVNETLGLVLDAETRVTQSEQRIKEYSDNASAKSEIATEKAEIATTKASESLASANKAEQSAKNSSDSASLSLEYSTSAGQSASSASLSASNASKSETNAKTSEFNAKTSEGLASQYSASAEQSATNASNSATTATNKAKEAGDFAVECANIKNSLGSIYSFKGSVATISDLPNNANVGDVYDVQDSGINYAWTGSIWDALGSNIDLSEYAKKSEIDSLVSNKQDKLTAGVGVTIEENVISSNTNIEKKGIYNSSTNYKAGEIVRYHVDNTDGYQYFMSLQNDNVGNYPSDLNAGYWAVLNNLGQLTYTRPSTDIPVCMISSYGSSGTTPSTWKIIVPQTKTIMEILPTINSTTGVMKVPAGIEGYYTKEEVDTTEQEIIENYMEADTALQTQITGLSNALDTAQDNIVSINGKISDSASSTNKLISNSELFDATQSVRSDFADADSDLQTQINGQATAIAGKQDKLVSGTNIKTINGESLLGGGDVDIKSAPDLDNKTITKNSSDQLQAVGVIDSNTSDAVKIWTGTKAQYDALTKDSNTLYHITDEESSIIDTINDLINANKNLLESIYPVGSVYLSTSSTCPLASLISGSTWEQMGTSLITSVNTSVPVKGTGKSLGLTDGTNNMGIQANGSYGVKNNKNLFDVNVGTKTGSAGPDNSYALGVTTDSSKSGIVGTVTRTSISVYIFKRTA